MRVFNLAEELEKERKKNKELKNRVDFLIDRNDKKQEVIDKAIEYIEEKYNCELFQNKKLLNILKGDNK